MYLQLNQDRYITGYALTGGIAGGVEVPDDYVNQIDIEKIGYYTFVDGVIKFDQQKYNAHLQEALADKIRTRRSNECFLIINRGKLWYDQLEDSELSELTSWYYAWLDAPKTGVAPKRPSFLENDIFDT